MPISPDYWSTQYENGHIPWDLGRSTPVFARLLSSGKLTPGSMIVLGAGRGHDARLFAAHGFAVTAVDFAPAAIEAMRADNDPKHPVRILQSDIFHLPAHLDQTFAYVLEYTCFCAIDPRQREAYAETVARLLKPGGHYIALAFPLVERAGGPPFGVSAEELVEMLERHELTLQHREQPRDSVPPRRGIEELLILQKHRPFADV